MTSSPCSTFDKSMLQCPVCFELRKGKYIYVCTVGHAICEVCFGRIDPKICPQGRCVYVEPTTRNFAMEAMIESALYGTEPCCFSESGCPFQSRSKASIERHQHTCEYKAYFPCPVDTSCKMWLTSSSSMLESHLRKHKNVSWMADSNCKMPVTEKWLMKKFEHLKAPRSHWNVVIIKYQDELFAIRLVKKNGMWYTFATSFGNSKSTCGYSVEIKAEFTESQDSAYWFRGDVLSSSYSAEDVIRKSRCLVLSNECVLNCIAADGISQASVKAGFDSRLTISYNIAPCKKSFFKK